MKFYFLLFLIFISFNSYSQFFNIIGQPVNTAQSVNTIYTAVPFLRFTPDARAGAMGETGIATSPDVSSIYWNTSKLNFIQEKNGVAVSYTPWLRDLVKGIYLLNASAYCKIDSLNVITTSVRYLRIASIDFTNNQGQFIQSFNPREFAFDAGYSRKLFRHFSMGLNLSYVYSNLAGGQSVNGVVIKPGTAFAGDLSFYFTHPVKPKSTFRKYNIGLAISNLGNKITYTQSADTKDFLPANIGLGSSFDFKFKSNHQLSLAFDINKLLVPTPDTALIFRSKSVVQGMVQSFSDAPGGFLEELHEIYYSAGLEYIFHDIASARMGYFYEHPTKGNRHYFTTGAGIKYRFLQLDFSYLYFVSSGLNNTWRLTFSFYPSEIKRKTTHS